jgi:alkanesulfonate monooxygenase SsuD/methylene tetrahydromethanopterin reductase-like flavin-dependent oxidoreductase (luciferase family)
MTVLDRVGVYLFPWGKRPPTIESLVHLAQHAERLGFDSVHVPWHFTLPNNWIFPGFGNRFLLDPLVVLPALVERTSRVRVSLNTAILPTLNPFFWAQYLASLDVDSGGRTIAGAAIGWWPDDFRIGGGALGERGRRMDEALEAVTRLWSGEAIEQPGRYWDLSGLALDPRPVQQPLPLWIGGGERSIERTARWASALMPLDMTPAGVRELRGRLDEAGERHGRRVELAMMNYLAVSDDERWLERARPRLLECMAFDNPAADPDESALLGTPERCAEQIRRFLDAGLDYVVLDCQLHGLEDAEYAKEQLSRFAEEVAPLLPL